jgi:hypothetical protein
MQIASHAAVPSAVHTPASHEPTVMNSVAPALHVQIHVLQ